MQARGTSAARTSREWATRVGLAVALGLIGVKSLALTWAQVVATTDLELAHRLAPANGRIAGNFAAAIVEADPGDAGWERPRAIAIQALAEDPTAVGAVSTLGLDAARRGDLALAERRFAYAQSLSRREVRTQLWAIENAVSHNDVRAALHQYDIALRTRPELWPLLFPVLASAIVDRELRQELVRLLATRPVWGADFTGFVLGEVSAGAVLPPLLLGLMRAGVPVSPDAHRRAIDRLLERTDVQGAWQYYRAVHPGADARRSRDPAFKGNPVAGLQFDWNLVNESGTSAAIVDGSLEWSVAQAMGGELARQMLVLPAGTYRLSGQDSGVDARESERPYWTLRCADGRELGRVILSAPGQAGAGYSGVFTVPAGCPMQHLVLVARAAATIGGLSGTIHRAELVPVG